MTAQSPSTNDLPGASSAELRGVVGVLLVLVLISPGAAAV